MGVGALVTQNAQAAQTIDSKAHVVIVGSGLGGQAAAHRLRKQLPNAKITVVDGKKDHIYQPGLTLVGTGIWDDSRNVELGSNASLLPAGVDLIAEGVAEFKPEQNQLVTTGGQTVQYDFMVVATGTHQKWDAIEGMDLNAIGQNGLASVYPGKDAAIGTWKAMDAYAKKAGEPFPPCPKPFSNVRARL